MSMMLQISLGLLPAILLVLGSVLLQRKKPALRLVLLGMLVAASVTCCVMHFATRAEVADESKGDSEELVDMVYALMATGSADEAEDFLKQVMETSVYVPDYALCQARIHVLRGDYTAAKMMYQKAMDEGMKGDDLQAEYDMVCRTFAPSGVDLSLLVHDPAYKQQVEGADQLIQDTTNARQEVVVLVNRNLQTLVTDVSKHITESVQNLQKAEELYRRYLKDEMVDEAQVEAIIKQLDALEKKYPALMEQAILREARMKMQLTKGDFSAIAKSVTERSGYKELMVVSELYINGYITEKDFSKTYGKENMAAMRAVREHLLQLYNNEYREESSSDRRKLKNYIDSLKYAIDNPALGQMQEDLKDYAQRYNAVDGSKIYMQLANLSYYQGNKLAADKHLSDSFRVVGNCRDEAFTGPMLAIIEAINNKQNTEGLKEVTRLVAQIMDNSTVMDLHQAVRVPNPEQEKPEEEEPKPGFGTYVSDYASQKRASISIVDLDASNFEEVVLELCVDGDLAYSAQELKKVLQIKDCNANIDSFTVEEITYDRVNIILVCDVSGSMDGSPIESLRQTVKKFIAGKTEKERIGLVTFSSYVEEVYGLDVSVEELNAAADRIYASGGTAIYDAMCYAVTMVGTDEDALNVILLLSDGQDNSPGSQWEIEENVCQPCVKNGVVIYPIGLGYGVDSQYLAQFGNGTGGEYLYVNDDATLNGTYEYIRNLMSTRYRVTYKAVDTMTNDRQVQVSIAGDDLSYDIWEYSLGREDDPTEQETMEDRFVTGLETRVLFKTTGTQTVNLLVSGFQEDDQVSVRLIGDQSFDLEVKRVSGSKYVLTIPSNIAVGMYDVQVKVNDGTVYLANELTVGMEETKIYFGAYTFTAYISKSNDTATILSGNVCMNGWLHFDGAITLWGDRENDSTIVMEDREGSRIIYDTQDAKGLAKYLAEKGAPVVLPALGSVTLYDDDYITTDVKEYSVAPIVLPVVRLARIFSFDGPTLYLYPHALKVELTDMIAKFPHQDRLVAAQGNKDLFKFKVESDLTLTKDNIDLMIKLEGKANGSAQKDKPGKLGNLPISLDLTDFEVKIDTLEDEYHIKLPIELNFMKAEGLTLELDWGAGFAITGFKVTCGKEINKVFSGVPVTFKDFFLGAKDLNGDDPKWSLEGGATIAAAEISAFLPGLEDYIGDISLVSLDPVSITLQFNSFCVTMEANMKMLGEIEVAKVQIQAGVIPYTNELLDMHETDVCGLRIYVEEGLEWDTDKCDVDIEGSGEWMLAPKVFGLTLGGKCHVDLKLWIWDGVSYEDASVFLGVYQDHEGTYVFTVRAVARDDEEKRGINVSWSEEYGASVETKFY